MAGILYVVATPIGNLEDVTLRALRILRDVSLIAAEDTRRTARLLQHYSISTRTTSLHEHNERGKTAKLIERLQAGESIALVSDAGTPLVSDPGRTLVAAARAAGVRIEPIPGASAVMAAVSASAFGDQFVFLGFPPSRSNDRKTWFDSLLRRDVPVVFFEAPHRILNALDQLARVYGADYTIGVARELTKTHEELVNRPISDLRQHFSEPKGEFTLIVPPPPLAPQTVGDAPDTQILQHELGVLTKNSQVRGRAAVKVLADRYGMSVNAMYDLLNQPADDG